MHSVCVFAIADIYNISVSEVLHLESLWKLTPLDSDIISSEATGGFGTFLPGPLLRFV